MLLGTGFEMCSRIIALGFLAALGVSFSSDSADQVCGRVVDEHDDGISAALVVPSGGGLQGWVETVSDGSFCLKYAGAFISVRHRGFSPALLPTSEVRQSRRIRLAKGAVAVRIVPLCKSLPNGAQGWIGSGLRVNPLSRHYKGPVNGEHDTHWYIHINKSTLNLVDGYLWHAGLPNEKLLLASKDIEVHGWEFENIVGLDLSGQLENGHRWRWFGAPIAEAIGYENTPRREADLFDRILDTVCLGAR